VACSPPHSAIQYAHQPSASHRWNFSAVVLASRVTQPSSAQDCRQYGFFSARICLNSLGFRILNLVLYSLVVLVCVTLLLIFAEKEMGLLQQSQDSQTRYNTVYFWRDSSLWVDAVILAINKRRLFNSCNHFRTLSLPPWSSWPLSSRSNGTLHSVNPLSSAGQTIPFIVGVGSLVRVFSVYSEPILKRRFGHDTQATSSLEAKDPPGLVALEVMLVPHSAPMEWIDLEPEATETWMGLVEGAPT
jgi:hypothetical protein